MKLNIKNISAIAACTLFSAAALTSCDDYLDVSPDSAFSSEEIFSNEKDTKAALTNIYAEMCANSLYGFAFPHTFRTNTDVEMAGSSTELPSNNDGSEVHCFSQTPNWTSLESTWEKAYEAINYCNDFLENITESEKFSKTVGDNGPTEFQQMYGEVHVLRALIYFDMLRTFGDLVFRTSSSKAGDDFYGEGLTDRNEIYKYLIDDLKDNEKYLKYSTQIDEGVERANREFCQALIGQMALYRAGYTLRDGGVNGIMEQPADYADYLQIAKEYLGKVITEGRHSLDVESFDQLWTNEMNLTVADGGDVIFEVPLMANGGGGNFGYQVGLAISYTLDAPGHTYGQSSNRATFCGMFPFTYDPKDLRLDITCVPYGYNNDFEKTIGFNGSKCVASWGCGKWDKTKLNFEVFKGYQGNTGVNNIRMRYADVLLMYAEVCNELDGAPSAAAKDALKAVRKRAFDPADHAVKVENYVNALNDHDSFFQALVNERAWEFAGEGVRKYDLARWNIYGKVLKNTYTKFREWGEIAQGGTLGEVRSIIYYNKIKDETTKKIIDIEFLAIHETVDQAKPYVDPTKGWTSEAYAKNWWLRNDDTGEWEVQDYVKWSFRGFVNYNNINSIGENDPVRYLMPYPSKIVTQHRGSIHQMYGYSE